MNKYELMHHNRKLLIASCDTPKTITELVEVTNIKRSLVQNHCLYLFKRGFMERTEIKIDGQIPYNQDRIMYNKLKEYEIDKPVIVIAEPKPSKNGVRKITMESLAIKIRESDRFRRNEHKSSRVFVTGNTLSMAV